MYSTESSCIRHDEIDDRQPSLVLALDFKTAGDGILDGTNHNCGVNKRTCRNFLFFRARYKPAREGIKVKAPLTKPSFMADVVTSSIIIVIIEAGGW